MTNLRVFLDYAQFIYHRRAIFEHKIFAHTLKNCRKGEKS